MKRGRMKGIKIYLIRRGHKSKPISFEKVAEYKFMKGFLCMSLSNGKYICYNLSRIERFEVD